MMGSMQIVDSGINEMGSKFIGFTFKLIPFEKQIHYPPNQVTVK